jgi:hypothetical protein
VITGSVNSSGAKLGGTNVGGLTNVGGAGGGIGIGSIAVGNNKLIQSE